MAGGASAPGPEHPHPAAAAGGTSGTAGGTLPSAGTFQWPGRKPEAYSSPARDALLIPGLALRVVSLALALISVALIATAQGERYYDDYRASYSFYTYRSLRTRPSKFILALGAIIILYELSVVVLVWLTSRAQQWVSHVGSRAATFVTFVLDQVLAYLMFAAATAGATYSALERYGDGTVGADCTRHSLGYKFCTQEAAAVSMAYLCFATLAVLALFSANNYFKHHHR